MTEKDITKLANRIADKVVIAIMKVKTMEELFEHAKYTESAYTRDTENLEMTEEENAIADIAKLMTLLNLFQEKEQYEKCAIVKRRITVVNKILKKYSK